MGRWSIPLRVNGAASIVSGGVWHADRPSLVWFWGIVVLLTCTLAARRVRSPELDRGVARALALTALAAIATAAVARDLHGRPAVSVFQLITFALTIAFVAWGARQVLLRRPGYFTYLAIAFVALWEGAELIPTLLDGFVLAAVPANVARVTAVLALGCGAGLLLLAFRLADHSEPPAEDDQRDENYGDAPVRQSYA